ncbi:hypothetical protein FHX52_2248, partial [Humibacillus xanthopallidus]
MTANPEMALRAEPGRARRHRWRAWAVIVLALALIGGLAAHALTSRGPADVRDGTELVTAEGMAARAGIEVSLVAVTAAGGLVEFRYQVVDPDKADRLVHDPTMRPIIVAEDTGATLVLSERPHQHAAELELGGTYFFLLANAENALHEGSRVTLVIGDA